MALSVLFGAPFEAYGGHLWGSLGSFAGRLGGPFWGLLVPLLGPFGFRFDAPFDPFGGLTLTSKFDDSAPGLELGLPGAGSLISRLPRAGS